MIALYHSSEYHLKDIKMKEWKALKILLLIKKLMWEGDRDDPGAGGRVTNHYNATNKTKES